MGSGPCRGLTPIFRKTFVRTLQYAAPMVRALVLIALLVAPLAHAETYKWVDAKGVVNYSNTPPPNAANAATVPDRISNYAPDPSITQAIDVNRRLDMAETEWLQRQWLMAMKQATPPAPATDVA